MTDNPLSPAHDNLDAWNETNGYAELCLVGAALHVDRERAAAVLALVHDRDLGDNRARMVWELIGTVVADGGTPDPILVVAAAQRAGRHGTAHALAALQNYLMDAFTTVPHPGNLEGYSRAVLEYSYRRSAHRFGDCLRQYANAGAITDLSHVLAREPGNLADLSARARQAEWSPITCEN